MTEVIRNPRQVFLGFLAITLGILIYIAFRPSGQTVWITGIVSLDWGRFPLSTEIGNNLPSFLHVVGFSLLTGGILVQKRWAYRITCGFWLWLNLLFECLQSDTVYTWLNSTSIHHDQLNPVVHWLENYSLHAVFDPKDIVALVMGAILSYIVLVETSKGE